MNSRALSLALLLLVPGLAAQECLETGLDVGDPPCDTGPCDPLAPLPTGPCWEVRPGTSIQDVISSLIGVPGPHTIRVCPGTYGPFVIPAIDFPDGLLIYAAEGPLDSVTGTPTTIIDGSLPPPPGLGPILNGSAIFVDGTGSSSLDGAIQIGWATSSDPSDWKGFYVTNGDHTSTTAGGGGLHADGLANTLAFKGNLFVDNQAVQAGGGVYLASCLDVLGAANVIQDNLAGVGAYDPMLAIRGGGLDQREGALQLFGTTLNGNGFGTATVVSPPGIEPARQGGGSAHSVHTGLIRVCTSTYLDNQAVQGNGIWIESVILEGPGLPEVDVQHNHVHDNFSWVPDTLSILLADGYRGGGLHVNVANDEADYMVQVYNNRFEANHVENPGVTIVGAGLDDVGGGAYVSGQIESGDVYDVSGNAAWLNTAPLAGGGFYLDVEVQSSALLFLHDTAAWNALEAGGLGGGLYVADDVTFLGSSGVFYDNSVPGTSGNAVDWYAEPSVSSVFAFTQLAAYTGAGANLSAGTMNGSSDPVLEPFGPHLQPFDAGGTLSPCINTAEGVALNFARDIDGHDRTIDFPGFGTSDGPDRGADEYVAFVRGDVFADGGLTLNDALYLANYLFSGGPAPVCPKAADVDDNGTLNLIDVLYLLNYMNNGGPPPSAPFPACGLDPTADTLSYGTGTPCL